MRKPTLKSKQNLPLGMFAQQRCLCCILILASFGAALHWLLGFTLLDLSSAVSSGEPRNAPRFGWDLGINADHIEAAVNHLQDTCAGADDEHLASPSRGGQPCPCRDGLRSFQPLEGGSLHSVYLVRCGNWDPATGGMGEIVLKFVNDFWRGCELQAEIGALRLVREQTQLPVPAVLGYSLDPRVSGGFAYLALEYTSQGARPLLEELPSMTSEERKEFFAHWARTLEQLQKISPTASQPSSTTSSNAVPPRYGSLSIDGSVKSLADRAGCTDLGPFSLYSDFAASKLVQFLPALPSRWAAMRESLSCFIDYVRQQHVDASDEQLRPTLVHNDLSAKNLLVRRLPNRHAVLAGILDWEFAQVAPAEQEYTSGSLTRGLSSLEASELWRAITARTGIERPSSSSSNNRIVHHAVYDALVQLTEARLQQLVEPEVLEREAVLRIVPILQGASCYPPAYLFDDTKN